MKNPFKVEAIIMLLFPVLVFVVAIFGAFVIPFYIAK